jgi:plasmid stabilization system protein ParE
MVYLVKTTLRAERDLAALYAEINAEESERARQWYFKLKAAILELGEMPNRHPITRENKRLRHSLFGHKPHVYPVIFQEKTASGGSSSCAAWTAARLQDN